MSFFAINPEKWESKYKEFAEKYDKKEMEHASSEQIPLTTQRLREIAIAQKQLLTPDTSSTEEPPKSGISN